MLADSAGAQYIPPPDRYSSGAASHEAQFNTVYLDVSLNGNPVGNLTPFIEKNGKLSASPSVLRSLGFRVPEAAAAPIALDEMESLVYRYNQQVQQISMTVPLDELDWEATQLTNETSADIDVSSGTGLLFNYDIYAWYSSSRYKSVSAFSELRFFSPLGVVSSTALFKRETGFVQGRWQSEAVRLDTQWETSWPASAISLRLGDTHTATLPWSRATRIGGIQVSRNFALKPYFSTAPLPSFLGSADIPSNAELYVNGIKQFEEQVPAGPFNIQTMPYISGAGNATLVLTDAMGKQRAVELPFYNSTSLLKKGLADWSVEAGYVRQAYGIKSFDYGHDPMYSGSIRYGMTNAITAEAHAESTKKLINYGAGFNARLGRFGVMSGSYASSTHDNVKGNMYGWAYQWQGSRFHISADLKKAQKTYRDVASLYGSEVPERNRILSTGINMDTWGQLGVSYINLKYYGQPADKYLNMYWSKQLNDTVNIALNYNKDLSSSGRQTLFLGVSFNFDRRYSAYVSATALNDTNRYSASLFRRSEDDEGLSWMIQSQYERHAAGLYASANYRGRYGEYSAGVQSDRGNSAAYANTTGSLVLMSGGVFASRQIQDGFAVVSTNGVRDVPVQLENRNYGTTNNSGLLIVTPLNAYQKNRISIDPAALPANMMIDKVDTTVAPERGSGTRVLFKIAPARAATVILHDREGQPLPLGTPVRLNDSADAVVGYDGIVYLEQLQSQNMATATPASGQCQVRFDYTDAEETIPRLGPLVCEE
ncbi:fimbria/pilus outer membrane usher protein [Advenella sp. S44]|uniref:fimbria/pilus outer membrane usher protein n=1 Tax=Advenella sp. S44 TaxID=1982755 RepID=UPI00137476DF|nr:fimbria/pilus outer membrane usher protein [Advenella sp. S44]